MNVSLDSSLVLDLCAGALEPEAAAAADALLESAQLSISALTLEELLRFPHRAGDSGRGRAIAADLLLFCQAVFVRSMDRTLAADVAALWALARARGKTSETVDTLIAREARAAGCILATSDLQQSRYVAVSFGDEWVWVASRIMDDATR